jgi:predicted HAD superfamily Cof-like phosphohydrolase
MNKYVDGVVSFMKKAGQQTPEVLTTPSESDRILRAKLILEEAFELINKGLGIEVSNFSHFLNPDNFSYVITSEPCIAEAMDGAADLFWVGVAGVSIIHGADLDAVLEEVDRSNHSKFIDGHRREDGKWIKGPSYSPADINGVLRDRVFWSNYYASPDGFGGWYITFKEFFDTNGTFDYRELDIDIPGFYEHDFSYFRPSDACSAEDSERMLIDLGFEIMTPDIGTDYA